MHHVLFVWSAFGAWLAVYVLDGMVKDVNLIPSIMYQTIYELLNV